MCNDSICKTGIKNLLISIISFQSSSAHIWCLPCQLDIRRSQTVTPFRFQMFSTAGTLISHLLFICFFHILYKRVGIQWIATGNFYDIHTAFFFALLHHYTFTETLGCNMFFCNLIDCWAVTRHGNHSKLFYCASQTCTLFIHWIREFQKILYTVSDIVIQTFSIFQFRIHYGFHVNSKQCLEIL